MPMRHPRSGPRRVHSFWANMRVGLLLIVAVAGTLAGCRLPGRTGPVTRSLVASRQLCQQGVSAIERDQWGRAETLLREAVDTCPFDPDARYYHAEALWHRGEREQAVSQMEEACRLAVDNAALHARLAGMRLAMGQVEAARRGVQDALDLEPKLAEAWAIRARVSRARGEPRRALADYHRALALLPDDRAIQLEIADVYRQLDQAQRALATLHRLAETYSPGEEPQQVLYLQGLAYAALERWDDAAERFSAAGSQGPPTAEILFQLGQAELHAGRPAAAAAAARQALALDRQHQPSRELLGQLELVLGPSDAARR